MGYRWNELQKLIGWSDEDMEKLKVEYEKIKEEEGRIQ